MQWQIGYSGIRYTGTRYTRISYNGTSLYNGVKYIGTRYTGINYLDKAQRSKVCRNIAVQQNMGCNGIKYNGN